MAATVLGIETLGGTQHGQKGQGPDPVGPGYGGQQHATEPAQATGFHHMRMRGPHGITVDAFRGNVLAASAFDGVIKAEDNDTSGDEHGYEEPEQQSTGVQRRPDGVIQDAMIRLKVGGRTASHNPENRRHRPLPGARTAPVMRTFTCCQTGREKTGAKTPMALLKAIGKDSWPPFG